MASGPLGGTQLGFCPAPPGLGGPSPVGRGLWARGTRARGPHRIPALSRSRDTACPDFPPAQTGRGGRAPASWEEAGRHGEGPGTRRGPGSAGTGGGRRCKRYPAAPRGPSGEEPAALGRASSRKEVPRITRSRGGVPSSSRRCVGWVGPGQEARP